MSEKNLNELISDMQMDIDKIRSQYMDKMQEAMKSVFASFFEAYPQVKTIYWTQWIPGFNDGEPCEFTVGEIWFNPLEWDELSEPNHDDQLEDLDGAESFNSYTPSHEVSAQMKSDMRNFESLMHSISDSLEPTFGSNSWIRAHRGGFEVEEYDCGY